MFCRQCGKEVDENANFCANCGAKLEKEQVQPPVEETVETVQEKGLDDVWETPASEETAQAVENHISTHTCPLVFRFLLHFTLFAFFQSRCGKKENFLCACAE